MQLLSMFWGQQQFRLAYTTGIGNLQDRSKYRLVRCWHWWAEDWLLTANILYHRVRHWHPGEFTSGSDPNTVPVTQLLKQMTCNIIIFLISRRFHSKYGLVSKAQVSDFQCRAGWEWYTTSLLTYLAIAESLFFFILS